MRFLWPAALFSLLALPLAVAWYLGQIVELAEADRLYEHPRHPYTGALLSAVPIPSANAEARRRRLVLEADVPSPHRATAGVPLPHALLEGPAGLPPGRAAARAEGAAGRRGVPLPALRG